MQLYYKAVVAALHNKVALLHMHQCIENRNLPNNTQLLVIAGAATRHFHKKTVLYALHVLI